MRGQYAIRAAFHRYDCSPLILPSPTFWNQANKKNLGAAPFPKGQVSAKLVPVSPEEQVFFGHIGTLYVSRFKLPAERIPKLIRDVTLDPHAKCHF